MSIELIPVIFFAWLFGLSAMVQANAGLLFFTPLFAILWTIGIIGVMRRWDGR